MLEVKNLHKTYKTKNGVITRALDDVSLTFAETGMVFILGKSGSGKSTLLNVCGGLDRADSGEIIIKGKSSSEFSGQDFDSYRNTYVGFVFQEYNILDEFSVEENIALALELQNKKRDKAVIDKILEDVDMSSFAQRKPNTLSGGQKQRVAIARALVKEPEIIMADEPTGALDSKTGQQVFDTLKKLSQTKLVLIVSHDREFAEQYGDRIIELKDGKVISDQVRAEEGDGAKNVRFFGSDTVSVQNGAELTDDDMQSIRTFLANAGGAAVISTSREHITEMKRDLPEMSLGAFEDVDEQPQSKAYPQQKLIRSHLPLRHAVKMGAGSLKTKPVRLVFTILLSVIAFILFGLASTLMLFDGKAVTKETLINADDDKVVLSKAYYRKCMDYEGDKLDFEYDDKLATNYTYDEYKAIRDKYDGSIAAVDADLYLSDISMPSAVQQFYANSLDGFVISDSGLEYSAGKAPSALDEIAVSEFILNGMSADKTEVYLYSETENDTVTVKVRTANDIIYSSANKLKLRIGNDYFKITGVFKSTAVPSVYSELKEAADKGLQYNGNYETTWQWNSARRSGLYSRIAVTEEFASEYVKSHVGGNSNFEGFDAYFDNSSSYVLIGYRAQNGIGGYAMSRMYKYEGKGNNAPLAIYDHNGNKLDSLESGSVAVHYMDWVSVVRSIMSELIWQSGNNPARDKYEAWRNNAVIQAEAEFIAKYPEPDYDADPIGWEEWQNNRDQYVNDKLKYSDPLESLYLILNGDVTDLAAIQSIIKTSGNFAVELGTDLKGVASSEYTNDEYDIKYAGMFFDGYPSSAVYLSDELFDAVFVSSAYGNVWHTEYSTKYVVPSDAYISQIFVPKTSATVEQLVDLTYTRAADDSSAMIRNSVMSQLDMAIDMADMLEFGFLIAGLVLALFAFLLMFNFISVSISAKKKEIGILRAIGARTVDVFKIFLSEALIIVLICFVISTLGTLGLCSLLNTMLITDTFLQVSLFVFGPLSVLLILGIALVTATLSTVIPVALYSRKPPIASIRAL